MSTPHPPDDDEIHTKGVRVTSAVKYAIILTVIQLVITVFAPLRFWLLRNRRRHSKLAVWSDGWFLFGWLVVMGHGWYAVPYAWFEVEKRRVAMTEREVVLMFVTENSGRVGISGLFWR